MNKITPAVILLILVCSKAEAGFLGSQLAYSNGFPSLPFAAGGHQYATTSYAAPYGASFAAPLPVAPFSDPHPYATVGYSSPPVFKFRSRGSSFGPFTTYASTRSHHKFAFPAAVPSFYNAPPALTYGAPAVGYDEFEGPSTVVKFGPPITTTTTTYSTTAAAAAPAVPVATALNAAAGW